MEELRRVEKERGIEPDPDIDAFMKADAIEGKRESIETEYVLHILGLNVCADTMVSNANPWSCILAAIATCPLFSIILRCDLSAGI